MLQRNGTGFVCLLKKMPIFGHLVPSGLVSDQFPHLPWPTGASAIGFPATTDAGNG
jgi:hypothetical protein